MNDKLELPEIQQSGKYRPETGRSSLNNGFFLRFLSGREPEVSCWKIFLKLKYTGRTWKVQLLVGRLHRNCKLAIEKFSL